MILKDRLLAFKRLQDFLLNPKKEFDLKFLINNACENNPWFTKSNIESALLALGHMLDSRALHKFSSLYPHNNNIKKVGVVIPSNIPLVGFYDFLCVLLSGNIFVGRLSVSNNVLLPFLAKLLVK